MTVYQTLSNWVNLTSSHVRLGLSDSLSSSDFLSWATWVYQTLWVHLTSSHVRLGLSDSLSSSDFLSCATWFIRLSQTGFIRHLLTGLWILSPMNPPDSTLSSLSHSLLFIYLSNLFHLGTSSGWHSKFLLLLRENKTNISWLDISKKIRLDTSCQSSAQQQFTGNAKSYFLCKIIIKLESFVCYNFA